MAKLYKRSHRAKGRAPEVVPTDTTKNEPTVPPDKYEIRKVQFQMNKLFADDNIDEKVFLGDFGVSKIPLRVLG
jgi:hypothetical protein